jgi:uncharacterized protein with HEPN domain
LPSDQPARRVADILGAIARIEAYVRDVGGIDAIMRDEYVHRDGVERQLLIIAEAVTKLRGQVEDLEPDIDWNAIRGIGNYIRHNYDGIQDEVIRRVLTSELQPLRKACERLRRAFAGD